MEKKGLSREELKERLEFYGFDIDKLHPKFIEELMKPFPWDYEFITDFKPTNSFKMFCDFDLRLLEMIRKVLENKKGNK
jgi:hypothetical protein